MEKKTDLRVIKTREAIKEAFIALVEQKGFEAMTVKDITERARMNRGTFYAHYEDKYHCLASYEAAFMEGIVAIASKHYPFSNGCVEHEANPALPIATDVFHYLYKERAFLKAILSPKGDPYFQARMKQTMWEQLFEKATTPLVDVNKMLVPPAYFASYISGAHVSVIQSWLNNGCIESPEEMAHVLSTLTAKGPFYAAGIQR